MKRSFKILSFVLILTLMVTPAFAANTFTGTSLPLPGGLNEGYLLGIWGANVSDIHVVGYGNDGSADYPMTYHYNGVNWTSNSPTLPIGWTSGSLRGVWGSSASNVYAVGFGSNSGVYTPLMYHYDGANWTEMPVTVPGGWTNTYFDGIWGLGANNIYALGYGYDGSNYTPWIYHYDGSTWTSAAPPMPGGWTFGGLYNAWGSASNDIYAVGVGYDGALANTLMYHFDGTTWTSSSPGLPGGWTYGYLWNVWGSASNNIYAFGGGREAGIDLPLIYYYDGIAWTYVSPALPAGWNYGYLFSGWGTGPNDIYAIGYGYNNTWDAFPLIYHFDGSNWTSVSLTLPGGFTQGQLWGSYGFAANNIYAAGYGYDGSNWVPLLYQGLDTTPPVVTVPADKTVEATSAAGAVVNFAAEVSATDDVSPSTPSVTCTPASGSTFALGTTNVDCQATDDASNTGHSYFNITVEDTTAPVLTQPNITVPQTMPAGAVVNYTASASDAVDANPTVVCAPVSGSTFPVGTTTVNCTVTDDYSNSSNGSFDVTVDGINLLTHPDFGGAYVFPYSWIATGFRPPYTSALDCINYLSAPCSVRFTGSVRNTLYSALQRLNRPGAAGDTYSFGLYSQASSVPAGGSYRVEVIFYNALNRVLGTSVVNFNTGTHAYELASGTAIAPVNYSRVGFRLVFQKTAGTAWFDDAYLYFTGSAP